MKVIADIGSNWHTLDDCMKAIKFAAKDDIDIVKFQYFTHEKLYGGIRSAHAKRKGELPKAWIPRLAAQCEELGLDFMCSVFDIHDVEYLDKYVCAHKIASAEATDVELLSAVVTNRGPNKKILVSTGCLDSSQDELLMPSGAFVHMACVSEYPAKGYPWDWMLMLRDYKEYQEYKFDNYDIQWGLSDHCKGNLGYEIAWHLGASYYEFHYNPLNLTTPDSPHSRDKFTRPKPFKQERNTEFL
jgi:sialic acid synthase SpsE